MSKGPKLNDISMSFTTRDNLGIESVATSMQAELCPVVNTVTPRAFYWPFMVWNYYDFLSNVKSDKWFVDEFDKPFLKKNDYFFVLATLMTKGSDQTNLVGKDKTALDLSVNRSNSFTYNKDYFVTKYGGMQYYNAGCFTMGFITDRDDKGNVFGFPRLTESVGKPMALAFEKKIKNTRYYKEYRLKKNPSIPRDVLEEYGKAIRFDLKGFDECKELLRKALFDPVNNAYLNNENLIASSEYLKMLYREYDIVYPDTATMRMVLFDYFSPLGEFKYEYYPELEYIIKAWEVVIGRSYFAIAIELIWKFIMEILETPMKKSQWIEESLKQAKWSIDIEKPLKSIIGKCNYTYEEREEMISSGYRKSKNTAYNIENGLKVLISISNRFREREDIDEALLEKGEDISIAELTKLIDEFSDKPIKSFIAYLIDNWIITQHIIIATNKLAQGRDGFYFEMIDGIYIRKQLPEPDYQRLRLVQLMQVMEDLDMLEE